MVISLIFTSIVYVLFSFARSVAQLMLAGLMDGFAEVPIWMCIQAIVADMPEGKKRGRAMGFYAAAWSAGFTFGPLVGGYLYGDLNGVNPAPFFVGGGVVLLSALLIALTNFPKPMLHTTISHGSFIRDLKNIRGFFPICILGVITAGVGSIVFKLFPAYASSIGLSSFEVGSIVGLSMLIRTLLFVPMGSLGDKIGFNRMVNYGLLGLAFIFACMMFARDFLQFALVLSVMAVAGTMLYPTLLAKASKIGEKQGIGRILSIYNFFTMVGWGIMPSIGGIIADLFDPTAPFLFSMLITLAAVIMNKSNLIKEKIRKIK